MKKHSKPFALLLCAALTLTPALAMTGCGTRSNSDMKGLAIDGTDFGITIEGTNVTEESVFTSNDIIYYEDMETYESGNPYGEGDTHECHTEEEAAAHTVINIVEPGTYTISGSMEKGQIRVDLGEDAETNPEAVVTLVLDSLDMTCEVAPAILFLNTYECDNGWTAETAQSAVDTSAAGANLVIADGSINNINGGHVAKIFEDAEGEEKLWKQDGGIYSYMSMNVSGGQAGDGILNLKADNEGLDTELHLTINGGIINIYSDNDGINTNEDGVSVTTINGGDLHILAGLGAEGDGIDSNGWLVINGGTVIASANPAADAGLDSDMGSYVNGGTVVAMGSTMDWAESESEQVTMNLQFAEYQEFGDVIQVRSSADDVPVFAFDPDADEVLSKYPRNYQGLILSSPEFVQDETYHVYMGSAQQSFTGTDVMMRPGSFGGGMGGFGGGHGPLGENGEFPEDFDPSQMPQGGGQNPPDLPEGFNPSQVLQDGQRPQRPEGMTPPEGMERPEAGTITETGEPRTDFYMQDKVNAFSGVDDAE